MQRPGWFDESLFPFESKFMEVETSTGHYVDEGKGDVTFLMLHGNPTWSFLYRSDNGSAKASEGTDHGQPGGDNPGLTRGSCGARLVGAKARFRPFQSEPRITLSPSPRPEHQICSVSHLPSTRSVTARPGWVRGDVGSRTR